MDNNVSNDLLMYEFFLADSDVLMNTVVFEKFCPFYCVTYKFANRDMHHVSRHSDEQSLTLTILCA